MNPPIIRVDDGEDNKGFDMNAYPIPGGGTGFLTVESAEANSHTYVYEPERDLNQMTLEAFPSEKNFEASFNRPTLEQLLDGQKMEQKEEEEEDEELKGKVIKFGWVEGVLMRCLLNIWGTMLFLRLTWVIGQAGIWQGLLIITVCNIVTIISAISMSAVATNGQIAAGGVYYMISRALGPSLGGSIGLMFTIANTISVATYTIGFAESLLDFLQDLVPGWDGIVTPLSECAVAGCRPNDVRIVGAPVLCLFLFIAFAGMDWVTRIQKSLLFLLLGAQVDMFLGSVIDVDFGSCYVLKIDETGYYNIDQDQRHAFGFTGWNTTTAEKNLNPNYRPSPISDNPDFMELYGVFFTAVTGIVAGANLSGDLKDPAEAIPKGTLLAIALTYVTYMFFGLTSGFVFEQAASGVKEDYVFSVRGWQEEWDYNGVDNATNLPDYKGLKMNMPIHTDCSVVASEWRDLVTSTGNWPWYDTGLQWNNGKGCSYGAAFDQMTMTYISFTGYMRYAGGFSASLSSAIASLVGAPRVLQAVGVDKIYPLVHYFAKGANANNDPYRGYILVFVIAMGLTLIADLNAVGVIASNFFLAAYALMNLSCFHSSFTKAPSWRPAYKWYNHWVSLAGSVMCVVIMFAMEWIYAAATISILVVLGAYILYRNPEANWGSSTQGQVFVSAVRAAQLCTETPEHVKNFRPKVLVMTGNPAHRPPLVNFATLITKSTSLLICGHVLKDPRTVNLQSLKNNVALWLKDHQVKGFYNVIQTMKFSEGAKAVMSLAGLGKLSPNMLLLGFKRDWRKEKDELREYMDTIFAAFDNNLSLGVLRVKQGFDFSRIIASEEVVTRPAVKKSTAPPQESNGDLENMGGNSLAPPPSPAKSRKVSIFRGADGHPLESKHVAGIQLFKEKRYTGYIDVWWLYDDGGMTLLLPYILTTRKNFQNCKLRVFSLANKAAELDREQRAMATLLAKFRIETSDVIVIPDITRKADNATKEEFGRTIEGADISQEELMEEREKTNRHLRLAELLRNYSAESELIVMTLPLPRRGQTNPELYMAWLDFMTKDLPPTLLIRGNQQNVLTFYS